MNISKTGYQFNRSRDGLIHTVEVFKEQSDGVLHFVAKFSQNKSFTGSEIFERLEQFELREEH